jgi:SAM-dependent MidA family methyltransferase
LVDQRDFLAAMGLEPRVNALLGERQTDQEKRELIIGAQRLVESPGMGTAYKALALSHPRPAGNAVGCSPMEQLAGFPPSPEASLAD